VFTPLFYIGIITIKPFICKRSIDRLFYTFTIQPALNTKSLVAGGFEAIERNPGGLAIAGLIEKSFTVAIHWLTPIPTGE
jgi:hypothetical protein